MKRILSFVLAMIIAICGISFGDYKEVKATELKNIYEIGTYDNSNIYLGGNLEVKMIFLDENMELIKNPDLSNYTILWEKYNKNTKSWEYYSNNKNLIIKNAKKDDFTNYKITLTNKRENEFNPEPCILTVNEISRSDYEKETTTEETTANNTPSEEIDIKEFKNFKNYCKIKKLNKNYNYTNKEIEPKIEVYSSNLKGTEYPVKLDPKYYTLTYKNNVKPGKASIIITGKAPYFGTKVVTFNIKPANSKVAKVKVKNKKIKVTCKKVKCDGYEFRYKKSTLKWGKSASKSGWKTKTQKSNKFTSKKLKKGNYFVQVRSYVKVGNKKMYSSYTSRDQMTIVGKSTKIEKGRYKQNFKFDGKKYKFYAPKYVSKRWGKCREWNCSWSDNDLSGKDGNKVPYITWIISYKRDTGYICLADKKGNIIEEGRIEKIYK